MAILLYKFTIFSFFLIILENIWQRTAAAETNQSNSDGEKFIEKVVNGEKTVIERPEYLLFTAPYKICDGECSNNEDNFIMEFPLYIGKKGLAKYTDFYRRDHQKVYSGRPNAPLKKRPTKKLFTLCPQIGSTTTSEKMGPSTEASTMQNTDTIIEELSSTTNRSAIDKKEERITETEHGTESEVESTTEIKSLSQSLQTDLDHSNETFQTKLIEIETEPQTELTNTELTIDVSQNEKKTGNLNDSGEINLDSRQAKQKQTENIQNENESINSNEKKKLIKANLKLSGKPQYNKESVNSKENMKNSPEVSGGLQFRDEVINVPNHADKNVMVNNLNRDVLLFRTTFTAFTNAMGEMCPFYVCRKKLKSNTDLNKQILVTTDQSYRDGVYARKDLENKENFKFENHREVTAANINVDINQRGYQMYNSEEFPPYSDSIDGYKYPKDLRIQSNEEDEFESYSDDTDEYKKKVKFYRKSYE